MYVPSKISWQINDIPSYPISSAKAPCVIGVSFVCVIFSLLSSWQANDISSLYSNPKYFHLPESPLLILDRFL